VVEYDLAGATPWVRVTDHPRGLAIRVDLDTPLRALGMGA
jgi:hypothetical protein